VFTGNPILRLRRDGDLIHPLGMAGKSMKISDMMINEKIPSPYREDWPLIAGESEILWVPGGRISQKAKISKDTKGILELKFVRRKK
jgi:tRNA(Ile)-lysidine synthase